MSTGFGSHLYLRDPSTYCNCLSTRDGTVSYTAVILVVELYVVQCVIMTFVRRRQGYRSANGWQHCLYSKRILVDQLIRRAHHLHSIATTVTNRPNLHTRYITMRWFTLV